MKEGYYWARHHDGTLFIVLLEDGQWYAAPARGPIIFDVNRIVQPVSTPGH